MGVFTAVIIVTVVVALLVNYIVAKSFGEISKMKGYPQDQYFWFCFLLGLPGWLMIASLPERKSREDWKNRESQEEQEEDPEEDLLPKL